jgi:hypothetical protein
MVLNFQSQNLNVFIFVDYGHNDPELYISGSKTPVIDEV